MIDISENERKAWLRVVRDNTEARLQSAIALKWLAVGTPPLLLLLLIAYIVR